MKFPNILMSVSRYGVIELNARNEVVWEYKLDEPERIYGLDYHAGLSACLIGYENRIRLIDRHSLAEIPEYNYTFSPGTRFHSTYFSSEYSSIIAPSATRDAIFIFDLGRRKEIFIIDLNKYFSKPDDLHEWGCDDWTHINFAKVYDDYIYATLYRHPTDRGKDGAILLINKDDYSLHRIISHYSLNRPHFAIPHPTIEQFMLVANTGSESVTAISKKTGATYWEYKINNGRNHIIPEEGRSPIACNFGAHYLETFNIAPTTDHALLMVIPNLRIARVIDLITRSTLHEYKVPEYIYKDAGIGEDPRPFQAKIL